MITREVLALLRKELRQVTRNRAAILSSTLLPLLLIVLTPMGQLMALTSVSNESEPSPPPADVALLPGMADFDSPEQFFLRFLFPMFITLGGVIVPSVAATYTVVAERERRTLDLLMALPVRVVDVIGAKLLAMLVLALGVVLPLFAIDAVFLLGSGLATPGYIGWTFLILFAALTCSIGIALLLALLARDFRTANNLNGAFIGPIVLLTMGVMFAVPGDLRFVVQIILLLAVAAVTLFAGLRWLTFERYLA